MIQVTANVYVEMGIPACNLGFITTEDGIVMIDTPMCPTNAVQWRNEVSKKGKIKYVINTEEHPDHYCGTCFFPGILVSHSITREKLSKFPNENFINMIRHADPDCESLIQDTYLRFADITFNDNLELHLGKLTIKLFHMPGHSTGGIGVFIPEEKVVFATDIVFNKKKSWLHEAVPSDWLKSLKKLKKLDADIIVPGHGDICNKDYLIKQATIIQGWTDVVQSAIKQGLSMEEAITRITTPDPHPKQQGTPFTESELHKMTVARLYEIYSK